MLLQALVFLNCECSLPPFLDHLSREANPFCHQYFEEKGEENVAVKYNSKAISSYCSPKFKLEGEFICEPVDRDFLNNDENFIEPDFSVLKKIQNELYF